MNRKQGENVGFWSFVGKKMLGFVLAILTFILFLSAGLAPLGGASTFTVIILWVLTLFCGAASWYFFKTE